MKNTLSAMAMIGLGSLGFAASAQVVPVSTVADLRKLTTQSTENVGYRWHGKHYYYRPHYGYGYGYDYGYGYGHGYPYGYHRWKNYCYNHPYYWKCQKYGY